MLLPRPLTLRAKDRKAPELGSKVRVAAVHLTPAADESGLAVLVNGTGLRDRNHAGFKEHDIAPETMWLGTNAADLTLEFELPEAVALGAIEVWNFNAEWQTTNGLRQADVEVSADGTTWQSVLRAASIAEAEGRPSYDAPTVLQLKGAMARKVRFSHLAPWGMGNRVGLSKVIFHQALGAQAGPRQPEDGATGVGLQSPALEWLAGQGATEHRVLLGTAPDQLTALGTTKETHLSASALKPNTAYYWRVDEVQAGGQVVTGRVARFDTAGLVAWWKLDEAEGDKALDASGHQFVGKIHGQPHWAPGQGRIGGAFEFDGKQNFIDCGNRPEFSFSAAMTMAVWVKVRQFEAEHAAIVTKGDGSWRLQRLEKSGKVTLDVSSKKLVRTSSKRSIDDGQWHHVVALIDGRRQALYVDGELEDSTEAMVPNETASPIQLGGNATFRERLFNGWLDEVRLYDYALSPEEIKALFSSGAERAAK